ncbi:MAG TPA: CHASE3 domain-containing protein, partial [Solirubrobacteraceae bacterium]|nr:CHASE3 domain-containing protein [Solirubrobacteraceae bacterium]
MTGGLTRRMVAASGLLALIIGAAFAVLLLAIHELHRSEGLASHSQQVLIASNECERLLLDLETGERGFLNTGQERFLQPWYAARADFPRRSRALLALLAGDPVDEALARRIAARETSYIRDYSVPLVNAERRGDLAARNYTAAEGKRRVDAIRADFDRLFRSERRSFMARDARAGDAAQRSNIAATVGLGGSIALIAVFAGYLTRSIARPVRRAAVMADRLAGGDLGAR